MTQFCEYDQNYDYANLNNWTWLKNSIVRYISLAWLALVSFSTVKPIQNLIFVIVMVFHCHVMFVVVRIIIYFSVMINCFIVVEFFDHVLTKFWSYFFGYVKQPQLSSKNFAMVNSTDVSCFTQTKKTRWLCKHHRVWNKQS